MILTCMKDIWRSTALLLTKKSAQYTKGSLPPISAESSEGESSSLPPINRIIIGFLIITLHPLTIPSHTYSYRLCIVLVI